MAYMRGDYYLWGDSVNVHLWVADEVEGGVEELAAGMSGMSLPEGVLDEYAAMCFAELVTTGKAEEAIARAVEKYGGNFGCMTLAKDADALRDFVQAANFVPPDPL